MVASLCLMPPEFAGNLPDLSLGGGKHSAIVWRFFDFVRRPRLCELVLQILESVRTHCTALAAEDDETHGSV
jgi:hypothetical protein